MANANEKTYYSADDVAKLTGRSKRYAYTLISKLNNELEEQGFMVIRGKVPKKKLYERLGLE